MTPPDRPAESAISGDVQDQDGLNRMKSGLLAMMSHEIRTPMQSVFGFLELMMLENPEDKMKTMITQAMGSASSVLEILDDILDVAKIDADKMALEKREIPLRTLVRGVLEALEPKIGAKKIRTFDDISPDVPRLVVGDPKRLRQILINLTGNAVKFTPEGDISIKVTVRKTMPLTLRFEVRDTGIGIDADAQQKLFAPFVQADNSTSREYGGTGLGLSISKKLVNLMGGTIGLESEKGKGTCFYFDIPFPDQVGSDQTKDLPGLDGLSILSVEPHPQAAQEIFSTLTFAGAQVQEANSVTDALSILAHRPFDVVLCEHSFQDSGSTGLDIIRYTAENWPRAGLVMYTSRDDPGLRQSLQSLGATYLEKPASRQGLCAAVAQKAIRQSGQADDHAGKILIVEDTESVRLLFKSQFAVLGCEADFATNGLEALDMMTVNDYALIVTDLHMPQLDGYGLIREIRNREAKSGNAEHIPVILLTADIQLSGYTAYMPLGFDECLLKPVSLGAIRQMLIRWNIPLGGVDELHGAVDLPDWTKNLTLIDAKTLSEQMGALDDSAREMLLCFPDMCRSILDAIRENAENGNITALADAAHSMKGAARSAGAGKLGEQAEIVQKEAEEGRIDKEKIARLAEIFKKTENEIATLR